MVAILGEPLDLGHLDVVCLPRNSGVKEEQRTIKFLDPVLTHDDLVDGDVVEPVELDDVQPAERGKDWS